MNYCILGVARSGLAVARLACTLNKQESNPDNSSVKSHGQITCETNNSVFIRELGSKEQFADAISELNYLGVDYEFGENSQTSSKADEALAKVDVLIISPGVPNDAPFVLKAQEKGIRVISELEFASQHINNPIIAVTGTNGKTTTTTLLTYMLNKSGKPAVSAGNIGFPLSDVANIILKSASDILPNNSTTHKLECECIDENTIIVTEVSSYQLQFIDTFRPNIAIILNVTPDHLKYHKTFENYLNTKLKIAKNQTSADYLILNADDEALDCVDITRFKKRTQINSTILQISLSSVGRGIYLLDDKININHFTTNLQKEEVMQVSEIKIPGVHNQYNSMAAAMAAKVWQLRNEDIRDSLMTFQGVEHRLEYVRTIRGVDYINDSKATNVNATWYALASYTKPIIWLAGGRGDNNDYSLLDKVVAKNVIKIIAFGEEKEAIYDRYCQSVNCEKVGDIYEAVNLAHKIAKKGQVVLFTPACKSFDQFQNYEQRGECYKQAIWKIGTMLN